MKKLLIRISLLLGLLIGLAGGWMIWNLRDRFPGYEIDLHILAQKAHPIKVGFAKVSITPELPDHWEDVNQDSMYRPDDQDYYKDNNQNGQFDVSWMAGFGKHRAANGIHDSLWARAMVIDDGTTRMAMVSIDAIGFGHDDVIRVREHIAPEAQLDYTTVTSTHTHEAPDLIGLWGPGMFISGVDQAYLNMVIKHTAKAAEQAATSLRPAKLRYAEDLEGAIPLLADTRDPQVLDPGIRILQAIDQETDTTLGTLFAWADHPETLWSKNLKITSDFPHYVREGMEKGVFDGDSLMFPGLGGICVYVNGAIGGLMTTDPRTSIKAPFADTSYLEPSFAKAKAQGDQLAMLGLASLRDSAAEEFDQASFSLRAKTLLLPMDNPLFRLAASLRVLDRGMPKWMQMRSEIAFWQLGPISCLQMPGEIYPEIINGGVENPEGGDFVIDPIETPSLRQSMPGKYQLMIGLANDMIGYVIPRSQWDEKAPFTYGNQDAPYGEINSVGSETAPILYEACKALISE